MKRKKLLYKLLGHRDYLLDINGWLRRKEIWWFPQDDEDNPLVINHYHHRRSIAVRSLKQLYGFTVSDLLLPIEFPERFKYPHGIGYKQFMGRRLYIF